MHALCVWAELAWRAARCCTRVCATLYAACPCARAPVHTACTAPRAEIFYILEGEVTFQFDDKDVPATPGTTICVPPYVYHQVLSEGGCKLITVFAPGGFDEYLAELVTCTESQFADAAFMDALGNKYDLFQGAEHPRGLKAPE